MASRILTRRWPRSRSASASSPKKASRTLAVLCTELPPSRRRTSAPGSTKHRCPTVPHWLDQGRPSSKGHLRSRPDLGPRGGDRVTRGRFLARVDGLGEAAPPRNGAFALLCAQISRRGHPRRALAAERDLPAPFQLEAGAQAGE